MREVTIDAHGRGAERDASHLRIPPVGELGANIKLLGNEPLLTDAALGLGQLGVKDVGVIHRLNDRGTGVNELAKLSAGILEKRGRGITWRCVIRVPLGKDLVGSVEIVARGGKAIHELLSRGPHGSPLVARARLLAQPKRDHVIATAPGGKRTERSHGIEEVGRRDHRGGHGVCRLCEKTACGSRRLVRGCERRRGTNGTGLGPPKRLEQRPRALGRHLERPLPTGFGLKRVGLVNDPVPHGRENRTVCLDVSQQQRVVRHHDVGRSRTATGTMEHAEVWVERALPALALLVRDGEQASRHASPAYAERINVAFDGLTRIGVGDGDGREHVGGHGVSRAAVARHVIERKLRVDASVQTIQAGIVVIPLQAGI